MLFLLGKNAAVFFIIEHPSQKQIAKNTHSIEMIMLILNML